MPTGYIKEEDNTDDSKGKKGKSLKTSTVVTGLFGVIAVGSIAGAVYFAVGDDQNDSSDDAENNTEVSEATGNEEEISEGRTEAPDVSEGRMGAAQAAADVLNMAYIDIETEEEMIELLEGIDEGDTSALNEDLENNVRFVEQFSEDEQLQATAYQTLIGFAATLKEIEGIDPEDDITVNVPEGTLEQYVLYDADLGIAQVSMSTFSQEYPFFSLEMVYTDSGWVLAPYSIVEAVAISSIMQGAGSGGGGLVPGDPGSVPDDMVPEDISPEDFDISDEEMNDLLRQMQEEQEGE